jgi:hypothetical protein
VRKKSHISLAKYLIATMDVQELSHYRKAFILGNILPDCKPSFITRKHEFDGTFEEVKERIKDLTEDCDVYSRNKRVYWRNLGQITHYLADYFTFPHNSNYDGSLKDHCSYEQELKLLLKEYIISGKAAMDREELVEIQSVEDLFRFIERKHTEYLEFKSNVSKDIQYILSVCHQIVYSVLALFNEKLVSILWPVVA